MTIASILREKGNAVTTVTGDLTIHDVVSLLHEHRIGALIVVDADRIAGVVSERDVVKFLHEKGAAILEAKARDIMTARVLTVGPTDSVGSALGLMTERRIRHLPVVDGERLVGIVSIGDLVKRRIDDAEHEAGLLKEYISS